MGPHSARESALISALMEVKSDGHWRPRDCLNQHNEAEVWEQETSFEEVPWQLLRHNQWKHVRKGTWRFNEDLSMLEARATVFSMRKFARTQLGSGFLRDNLGIVLASERCQSSHFGVLHTFGTSNHTVLNLASERTTAGFPLKSMRAVVALAQLQSKTQSWWQIFWTTNTVNCTVSVSIF